MFWLFSSFVICFFEKKKNTEKGHWKISQNNGNIAFRNIPIVLLKKGKTQFKKNEYFERCNSILTKYQQDPIICDYIITYAREDHIFFASFEE